MDLNRRSFLKAAGLTTLAGLGGHAAMELLAPGALDAAVSAKIEAFPEALTAKRWAMLIDTNKFASIRLYQQCIDACHKAHNVPEIPGKQEVKWQTFLSGSTTRLGSRKNQASTVSAFVQSLRQPSVRACLSDQGHIQT